MAKHNFRSFTAAAAAATYPMAATNNLLRIKCILNRLIKVLVLQAQ